MRIRRIAIPSARANIDKETVNEYYSDQIMPQETEPHRRQIDLATERAADVVKTNVLDHLRERFPVLPAYDGMLQTLGPPDEELILKNPKLRRGLKIAGSGYSIDRPLIVLEENGLYVIPTRMQPDNLTQSDWTNMKELTPIGYLRYGPIAIDEIDRLAEAYQERVKVQG